MRRVAELPEGFTRRRSDLLADALERVETIYWHTWGKDNRYHSTNQTAEWLRISGEYGALMWACGFTPFPPGCSVPVTRTRANLLLLAAMMELACNDQDNDWEDRARGGRNLVDEYVDSTHAYGASLTYALLLRDTFVMPHNTLIPEQLRPMTEQARQFYQQARENPTSTQERKAA